MHLKKKHEEDNIENEKCRCIIGFDKVCNKRRQM